MTDTQRLRKRQHVAAVECGSIPMFITFWTINVLQITVVVATVTECIFCARVFTYIHSTNMYRGPNGRQVLCGELPVGL